MLNQSNNSKPTKNIKIESGIGELFYDSNGKEYIDLSCQTMNLLMGQSNMDINNAITNQLNKLTFIDQDFECLSYSKAIGQLEKLLPKKFDIINLRMSDGSSAVECAVKMAIKYRPRKKILTVEGIYLGQNNHTLALRGWGKSRSEVIYGLKQEVIFAPSPTPNYNISFSDNLDENGTTITQIIHEEHENISCLILDPIMISDGITTGRGLNIFIKNAIEVAREYDIPVILDECQTFGWVPNYTLTQYYNFKPDILVLGKCLGGGLPLSAVITTKKFDNLNWGDADYTNGGTLAAIAALEKTCELIQKKSTVDNFNLLNDLLNNWCDKINNNYNDKVICNGIGLIRAICIYPKDLKTKGEEKADFISKKLLESGIYIRKHRNCLTIKLSILTRENKLLQALKFIEQELKLI